MRVQYELVTTDGAPVSHHDITIGEDRNVRVKSVRNVDTLSGDGPELVITYELLPKGEVTAMKVKVTLFKPSGKYYTSEEWEVPKEVPDHSPMRGDFVRETLGPYDMRHSKDFRRISGGAVLIDSQEPWGYPHLFPNEQLTALTDPDNVQFEVVEDEL
jgi:hypothetical protein